MSKLAATRVDHVGSLLRPQALKSAFLAFGAAKLSAGNCDERKTKQYVPSLPERKLERMLETARRVWNGK